MQSMEDKFTSTGSKLRRWHDRLLMYKSVGVASPISTHISPEGACNLNCSYCSVSKRKKASRIELGVIKQYLDDLCKKGLKAVIITGGGEPTIYPNINALLKYIYSLGLKCALITNGTSLYKINTHLLNKLSWLRISINEEAMEKIVIPPITDVTIGFSYIVPDNSSITDIIKTIMTINGVLVKPYKPEYVRLLPNCLLPKQELNAQHRRIHAAVEVAYPDSVFFHQNKGPAVPSAALETCPMGYFRPYLSEQVNHKGYPGTIYPCDSVVLNDAAGHFNPKYAIGAADEINDYLTGSIRPTFKPCEDCKGCVFTRNLNIIEEFCSEPKHAEFI